MTRFGCSSKELDINKYSLDPISYTMRKNLPKTLDQLIFFKYTLVFSKCSQIY